MYSDFTFLQILCTQFWKPFLGLRLYFQDVKLNDPCWVPSNLRNSETSLSVLCVLYSLFICSVLCSFLNPNRPDNFCLPYLLFLFNWVENGTLILASYDGHDLLPAPAIADKDHWLGAYLTLPTLFLFAQSLEAKAFLGETFLLFVIVFVFLCDWNAPGWMRVWVCFVLYITWLGSEPEKLFDVREIMEGEDKREQLKLTCKVLISQIYLCFLRWLYIET